MDIIADTNIFLAIALDEPEKEYIIEMTSESDAHSPEILPYEIGNALTAMIKRGQISKKEALSTFEITRNIPVRLLPADIPKALDIAMRFNIYAYDAYFIQVAQFMACPLLTLDKKMKEVAGKLNISLLE
ncbi:MAG: type II toxin-antitoxin system VapC family toxin [Candidatus Scalindua sp.]|nr:type II toxin-antitoxin system VapC family toxin [Candidatus Scalindua sp.]